MHSFESLCKYLFELRAFGDEKENFLCMHKLLEKLGHPEKKYKTIHVAGTNGKGSVSLKLARALQLSGCKVGLYTSPHLFSVQERIQVHNEGIPKDRFCVLCERVLNLANQEKIRMSFFEILTLAAFVYFEEQEVDVAIIETGIGGTFDTTNVITPCLSVITSISMEHADTLGNTLEEIAEHKAGIIKQSVPVVIGPRAHFLPIFESAKKRDAPLVTIEECSPFYDIENQAVARAALEWLGLTQEAIEEGIKVRPFCRFEHIGNVLFDVAHNPDGIRKLLEAIEYHFPGKPFQVLVGMSKDKDLSCCLSQLAAHAKRLHLVPIPLYKGATPQDLAEILIQHGYENYTSYASITEGMQTALSYPELLIVCGSFYLMSDAKNAIRECLAYEGSWQ